MFVLFFALASEQKSPIKFSEIPLEDLKMVINDKDSSTPAVVPTDFGQSSIIYNQTEGLTLIFETLQRSKILTKDGLTGRPFSSNCIMAAPVKKSSQG